MAGAHSALEWLQILFLGGIAGMLGQGARVIVGMKKLSEEAAAKGTETKDLVEPSRLMISLLIGFTAGALAALSSVSGANDIGTQQVLALAGAGYAGADFIEGAMSRFQPKPPPKDANAGGATQPQVSAADTAVG